jgi:hypothetical protein
MMQRVKTSVLVPGGPAEASPDAQWAIRADSSVSSETK